MFFRTTLLVSALAISQVAATSDLHRRNIEFLEARQSTCTTTCNIFSDMIAGCKDLPCICNAAVAASLQTCITCAVTQSATSSVISSAQQLIDTYSQTCASVAGVPAVTLPGTHSTTSTRTRTPSISVALPSSTTTITRSTVTGGSAPPLVTQSTFTGSSTEDPFPTDTIGVPGVVTNDGTQSYSPKQAGLVAISAMLGAALVL